MSRALWTTFTAAFVVAGPAAGDEPAGITSFLQHSMDISAHKARQPRTVSLVKDDNPLAVLPPLAVRESAQMVFAVVTGKLYHKERAEVAKQTWCSYPQVSCIFVSEAPDPTLPTVVVDGIGSNYRDAQLKFLPALQLLKYTSAYLTGFPKTNWFAVVDDDTYVFPHNLFQALADYDDTQALYLGDVLNKPTKDMPCKFVMGGGGSIFTRAALDKLDVNRCIESSMDPNHPWYLMNSDWMIGGCANESGIEATFAEQFHQGRPGMPLRRRSPSAWMTMLSAPATIHPVKGEAMRALFADTPDANTITLPLVPISCFEKGVCYGGNGDDQSECDPYERGCLQAELSNSSR